MELLAAVLQEEGGNAQDWDEGQWRVLWQAAMDGADLIFYLDRDREPSSPCM